ncbi:MAG: hypothetical protein Q9172_003590 [Xanthocarpia lactea]
MVMENPACSKQQLTHTDIISNSLLASYFKGLQIYARWDGVQEHPAAVLIQYTIEAQPSTHLPLFKTEDPLVASHNIRSVVSNSVQPHDITPYGNSTELKELHGDTLTASEAEEYIYTIKHESSLEDNKVESVPLQALSSSASNRHALQATLKGGIVVEDVTTIGNRFPKRQVSFSDPGTPQTPTGDENRASHALVKVPYHSQPLNGPSLTADDWPVQSPRRFKIGSRDPRLNDFTIHKDQPHLQTPTHKPRKPATLPRPSRLGYEISRYYGTLPLSRPSKSKSVTGSPESSSSVVTVVDLPLASDPCVDDQKSPRVWVNETCYVDCILPIVQGIDAIDNAASQPSSPSSKDKLVNQGRIHDTKLSEPSHMWKPVTTKHPMMAVSSDVLYVYFPSEMCPDSYSIEADLDVFLSEPNCQGWQSFMIPGLPTNPFCDVRGIIQFTLISPSDHHAPIRQAQFDPSGFSLIQGVQKNHIEGGFTTAEPFSLRLRLESEVKQIHEWNSDVAIHSSIHYTKGQGIYMRNQANLTVEPTKEGTFARRANFSVLIRNGPPSGGIYRLKSGECLVELPLYEYNVTDFDRTVEIWIERDDQDMEKQLKLEFTCLYPGIKEASILLPVVFPKLGKVLSENIWLFKPLPPLAVYPVIRKFLSTWSFSEQLVGRREVLCFTRMEMPPRYPNALSDDAVVRLCNLEPVSFVGLNAPEDFGQVEKCSNVVPSLDYVVDMLPDNRLGCRILFDLEVGTQQHLLNVEAKDWVPISSSINGRVCSQDHPCWWEEDNQMCLYKPPWMMSGDILHIKLAFIMIGRIDDLATKKDHFVTVNINLPRIMDKVIFGGDLVCNINDAVVTLVSDQDNNHYNEDIRFLTCYGENTKRLPILQRGYTLGLMFKMLNPIWRDPSKTPEPLEIADKIRFSEGFPLQPRTLRFDDEASSTAASSSSSDNSNHEPNSPGACDTTDKQAIEALNNADEETDFSEREIKLQPAAAGKDVRRRWRHQLRASNRGSSSSDDGEDSSVENNNEGSDVDEEDEGSGWFLIAIWRAFKTCVRLAHVIYRYWYRRSSMRFIIGLLVLGPIYFLLHYHADLDLHGLQTGSNETLTVNMNTCQQEVYYLADIDVPPEINAVPLPMARGEQALEESDSEGLDDEQDESFRDRVDKWLGWRPVAN